MLSRLAIRDLVLVDRVQLELAAGLCVLTGETGAGKSILLDALGLALGQRADAGLVRADAAEAEVVAHFALPPGHALAGVLQHLGIEDMGGDQADNELVVRRTLRADGRSRAFVQGVAVPAQALRDMLAGLVEVHGQHESDGLLSPRRHRALLDAFAGHGALLHEVAAAAGRLADLEEEAAELGRRAEADARERLFVEQVVAELAALAPEPGEEQRLADERRRIQAAERRAGALTEVEGWIAGSEGALALLRRAARPLQRMADDEPALADALDALDRALVEGDRIETALAAAAARGRVSPADRDAREERLLALREAARKHRVEPDALAGLHDELARRLDGLAGDGARLAALGGELARARGALAEAAGRLSASRAAAARRFEKALAGELAPLRLGGARVRVALEPVEPGAQGAERVLFEAETNPGQGFGPLHRVGSGGELSRLMLAARVVLAGAGETATLVLDEIDRGVGGATAAAIGQRLARLADRMQLLVVTHSPQVAAAGRQHWRIAKDTAHGAVRTRVEELGADSRVDEVARMLSGAALTPEARAQAQRLLAEAGAAPSQATAGPPAGPRRTRSTSTSTSPAPTTGSMAR